jgi:hypothetical protein
MCSVCVAMYGAEWSDLLLPVSAAAALGAGLMYFVKHYLPGARPALPAAAAPATANTAAGANATAAVSARAHARACGFDHS